jgi:protein-ribulosamine 3-kinase
MLLKECRLTWTHSDEYDTGNWRAPRHRLSHPDYIKNYKLRYPPSEPVEDWNARNILYSLTFNMGNIIQIAGSTQRQVVYEDMLTLCKLFFPEDLRRKLQALGAANTNVERGDGQEAEQATAGAEAPEEEEEEEEEEMDWK